MANYLVSFVLINYSAKKIFKTQQTSKQTNIIWIDTNEQLLQGDQYKKMLLDKLGIDYNTLLLIESIKRI